MKSIRICVISGEKTHGIICGQSYIIISNSQTHLLAMATP